MEIHSSAPPGLSRRAFLIGSVLALTGCATDAILSDQERLEKYIRGYRVRLGENERTIPRDTHLRATEKPGIYQIISKHISRITETPLYIDTTGTLLTREIMIHVEEGSIVALVLSGNGIERGDTCTVIQSPGLIQIQKKHP